MKLYDKTVHCTINLPVEANELIEKEVQRTGIQKAIFLRCLILKWVDTKTKTPVVEETSQIFQVLKEQHNESG